MNKLKFKIKNLILAIFGAFSLLLICITLLLQYNYSYSVVEKSTSSLIDRITINTTQQLHDFEDKMALGIDMVEHFNATNILPDENNLHIMTKRMATLMENNPYILATYFGYENGTFFELINLDIHEDMKSIYNKQEMEKWLVVKVFNHGTKDMSIAENYFDEEFNLLREKPSTNGGGISIEVKSILIKSLIS